jgi:hypothetical protein
MPKRNLERMRELLILAEGIEIDPEDSFEDGFVDIEDKLVRNDGYQLILMRDAEWIDGRDANLGLFRVTNLGHEYLDATRQAGVWEKVQSQVKEQGGNVSLEIVKKLAIAFGKKQIEERTGLEL